MNLINNGGGRKFVSALAALAMVMTVSACHTPAHRDGLAYIATGVVFAAGIVLAGSLGSGHYSDGSSDDSSGGLFLGSDSRLKTDMRHETTLENGLKVYSYRYIGDERLFLGVIAQDLLNDERFSFAVSKSASGYLLVDYGALGLEVANPEVLHEASQAALARAS